MIDTKHLYKVAAAWISVVYAVCFLGVAAWPGMRSWFMLYGLHVNVNTGEDVLTIWTFLSGLVIWNIIVHLAVRLYAVLFKAIKK